MGVRKTQVEHEGRDIMFQQKEEHLQTLARRKWSTVMMGAGLRCMFLPIVHRASAWDPFYLLLLVFRPTYI
jgi:hypothetical protein